MYFCLECYVGTYLYSDRWLYGAEKSSPMECQELCRLDSNCNSWDIYSTSSSCWLNEASFAVSKTSYMSQFVTAGPKECGQACFLEDMDSYGHDIRLGVDQWSPTAAECQRRCKQLEGCVSFTFVHHDYEAVPAKRGACMLKTTGVEAFDYYGYGQITSGLANC